MYLPEQGGGGGGARKPVSGARQGSRLSWFSHEGGATCMEAGENQVVWETSRRDNQVWVFSEVPVQSSPGFHSSGRSIAVVEFGKKGKPGKQEVPSQLQLNQG